MRYCSCHVPSALTRAQLTNSSNLPEAGTTEACNINRRYIDANRVSYRFHTHTNTTTFDTVSRAAILAPANCQLRSDGPQFKLELTTQSLGEGITSHLLTLALQLNISTPLGYAPNDLYLARYPYGHPQSALTHFADEVLPKTIVDENRQGEKMVIIGNSGSLRFDLVSLSKRQAYSAILH